MPDEVNKKIVIGITRERSPVTSKRGFVKRLETFYTIGDEEFSVTIDKEGATAETIEKAVIEDAKKFIKLEGKIVTI